MLRKEELLKGNAVLQAELAIAREQKKAATERAAELAKANEALKRMLDKEQQKAAQERAAELAKINAALETEVIERSRAERLARGQTEALVRMLTALAREPVLDNFLGCVLQAIADQLGDSSGGIYLYSEEHDISILHLNYENGQIQQGNQIDHPYAQLSNPHRQWDDEFLSQLQHNQVLIHHEQEFATLPCYAPYREHNTKRSIKTLLFVPLMSGDRFLGSITLRSTRHRNYQPEELELARALAYQCTLAIQITRLAEQTRQAAIFEERNRLAREIHDTLAQAFTGVGMQLEAATRFLATKPDQARSCITRAQKLAHSGLAEARRSVWALQPEADEYSNFPTTLRRIVEQLTADTSVRAEVCVQGTVRPLPPAIGMNLLRIGQEALTNALRHAIAHSIQILIVYEPHQVQLSVQDDGQGFNPQLSIGSGGFGLMGLQQRAERLGGTATIISQPENGTLVRVVVPISEV